MFAPSLLLRITTAISILISAVANGDPGNPYVGTVLRLPIILQSAQLTGTPPIQPSATPTPTASASPTATLAGPTATLTLTVTSTAVPTDTPTSTPTDTATATATDTPTSTPTDTATATATDTPTSTPTDTATATDIPTSTPTDTATATDIPTSTPTDTATATDVPTSTPTDTATSTPTDTPTSTPTDTATATATDTPTSTATSTPTATATDTPTSTPTSTATSTPTATATAVVLPNGCPLLDDFNRSNGGLGASWFEVNPGAYTIQGNAVILTSSTAGVGIWSSTNFGANQQACVRFLSSVGSGVVGLALKSSHNNASPSSVILVELAPGSELGISTYDSSNGTFLWNSTTVSLAPGDVLGAIAHSDGTIEAYVNTTQVLTVDLDGWGHETGGGYIGITGETIGSSVIVDDFGGGDYGAGLAPINATDLRASAPAFSLDAFGAWLDNLVSFAASVFGFADGGVSAGQADPGRLSTDPARLIEARRLEELRLI